MKKISIVLLLLLIIFTTSCSIDEVIDELLDDDEPIIEDVVDPIEPVDPITDNTTPTGKVNIIEINDTHGACLTDDSTIGLDKVQSVITSLEKTDGDYIKIANGDIFQGGYLSNMTEGRVFIDMLNAMEFDCFVIGNHDFDWGLDTISKYKDGDESNGELNCKFLACNIIDTSTNQRPSWIDEYEIVYNNGYKVGIIGAIGDSLESSISADKVAGYEFVNPDERIQELAKNLREEQNCDVVILSIHEYEISHNETIATFSTSSSVDGIVCGHTHQKISDYEYGPNNKKIPVVQSYTKNGCVGVINYTLDEDKNITSSTIRHITPSNFPSDSTILNIGKQYEETSSSGEEVIFTTTKYLSKEDIGIMFSNALATEHECDFAVTNTGGIRTTLTKGDVKLKDILEVYPFDNKVVIINIDGKTLKNYLKANSGYLYVSDINSSSSIYNNKIYKLATVDYVYTSSYSSKYFDGLDAEVTDYIARDSFVEYLKNNK